MPRSTSLCAALVAVTLPVALTVLAHPSVAAEPEDGQETVRAAAGRAPPVSRRSKRPAVTTPLAVTIDELTPSTIPERGPIRISGTVTNTDDVPWRSINIYAFVSAEPLTSTEDLAAAAESDPTSDVGERIVEEGNYATIDAIAPGDTQLFSFKVSQHLLEADTPGVYWFGVHALGDADGAVQDPVPLADGRARTFLPFVPPSRPGQVATAIVVPLRHSLDRADDGSMADVAGWTRTLSTDGQLRSLVDFGAAAGSRTVSWVIDPALIDAVQRLAAGNPPRSLAPTLVPGPDGEPTTPTDPATPTDGASASPDADSEDSGSPEGGDEEAAELDPVTRAAAEAAQAWLASLEAALPGDAVLVLPYGDTDVSGAAKQDPETYLVAVERSGDVLAPFELRGSPVVASPSGFLSREGLRTVEPGTTVLVTDQMFGSSPPAVADTGGQTVVVTATGGVAGGPGPGEARSMLAMRQRLLAEAAVRFLTARRPPLVVQLPPDWRPGSTLGFFSGLDVGWLDLTSVQQAAATGRVRPVPVDRLRYPETQIEAELDAANFIAADELAGAGISLQNTLTLNDVVGAEVTDEALGSVSYSARIRPNASRAAANRSHAWIDAKLARIRVRAPSAVTLSSTTGRFAATVRNDLDQPVTVTLEPHSDEALQVEVAQEIDVPARGRTTVLLNAETDENGIHDVVLVLTDEAGTPIGATTELSVRSAQVSNVIWLFIGGGLALLFTAIGVRLVGGSGTRSAGATRPARTSRTSPTGPTRSRPGSSHREGPRAVSGGSTGDEVIEPADADLMAQQHELQNEQVAEQSEVLAASAVMAAGTVLSRLSGYVRTILLAAALGNLIHADVFNIANTVPNMIYILVAGGIVNAVLVPQLVRSMKTDPDGGDAYTNRVVTLAALFLGGVTVLLIVAAPWLMRLFVDPTWPPEARDSLVDFARLCLPQVFFYGMYVLVGQILNARGRFGPMMWAPIANNVISVAVLLIYLGVFGSDDPLSGDYATNQILLLGIGSTIGILAQFVILVPYLRSVGYRWRPRFDFLDTGLGHTLRLGVWTVLFVIVNQVAYTVVVRLSSSGTASGSPDGTGYSVYSSAFLIMMVPHSVITVSLATAILPTMSRRAADADLSGLARTLGTTLRTALVVVVPFAGLLLVLAPSLSQVVWGYGAAADTVENYAPSLALFGPGLVVFTVHYLMLRGFYALEQTRLVFLIQCGVAVTNVVVAVLLVGRTDDADTSPALVLAYTASYLVGAVASYLILRRRVGGLAGSAPVAFLARLVVAVLLSTGAAAVVERLLPELSREPHLVPALLHSVAIAGVAIVVFLGAARLVRLSEVSEMLAIVMRRRPARSV